MNVLVVSNVLSGLNLFRSELIESLSRDNSVTIITEVDAENNGGRDKFEALGVKFVEVESNRQGTDPFQDIKLQRFYKSQIKKLKPDVVLTYTIKPNVYAGAVCASMGVPYVANVTGLGAALENKGLLQKICLFLYRRGLRKAQKVFFQNQSNLDFMLKHKVVRDNYDLLPGSGVNLQRYTPSEYPGGDEINFAFVGRIMKPKGVDEYFEAAKYLRKKYPQTNFNVYGYFEKGYEELVERLHNEKIINYCGVAKDMPAVYRAAHCVVLPTYYPEGMSNVLLEACASARPIVTTDRPGCREVIVDGFNGYKVKAKDPKDLIRILERFINLPDSEKKQFGLNARKHVEVNFDRQIVVQKYLDELARIL